jgi:hypothetical protein
MANALGIVLTGTAIGITNEMMQGYKFNFRMGMAGLGAGLFIRGIEKVNETAGTGLAVIVFITMMITPFKGNAPAQTLANLIAAPHPGPQKDTGTTSTSTGTTPPKGTMIV